MPISQRIAFILMFVLFAIAYGTGMTMLFELSAVAPFIVTGILTIGVAIALPKVKRAALLEGAKPNPQYEDQSLLGLIKTMIAAFATVCAVVGAFQISAAAGVAVIELIVFSFMIAMVLIFLFARIEIQTRARLAAKTV